MRNYKSDIDAGEDLKRVAIAFRDGRKSVRVLNYKVYKVPVMPHTTLIDLPDYETLLRSTIKAISCSESDTELFSLYKNIDYIKDVVLYVWGALLVDHQCEIEHWDTTEWEENNDTNDTKTV